MYRISLCRGQIQNESDNVFSVHVEYVKAFKAERQIAANSQKLLLIFKETSIAIIMKDKPLSLHIGTSHRVLRHVQQSLTSGLWGSCRIQEIH